jgi:PAS domain S-box-containing protein
MAGHRIVPSSQSELSPKGFRCAKQSSGPVELLNLTSDAIIVCGIDRRINFWNSGAVAMYGWDLQEALGENIYELLKTTFPETHEAARQTLINEGIWQGEVTHVSKRGKRIPVMTTHLLQRDASGTAVWILEIDRDITSRPRMPNE